MYSVSICSCWWVVHICIYFVSSVVFVDFLIKSSFQKKLLFNFTLNLRPMLSVKIAAYDDMYFNCIDICFIVLHIDEHNAGITDAALFL